MNINVNRIFFITFVVSVYSKRFDFLKCSSNYEEFDISFNCTKLEGLIVHSDYFDESVWGYSCSVVNKWDEVYNKPYIYAIGMNFENCRFSHMPSVFFQREIVKVRKIQLDHSGIETMNNEVFSKNCSLEILSMSFNELTELLPFLFSHAPNISEINFSNNHISSIHPNTFREYKNKFKVINLSYNRIETLDKLLFIDLASLEELDLRYNFIEDLQIDLSKLKNLKNLRLDNNKIIQLNCDNVFNLAATTTINIDVTMNRLKNIDLNCSVNLKSLSLNISDNHLENLIFPASKLVNSLEQITVSRNNISRISIDGNKINFMKVSLRNLKLFDLSHNKLTKIEFELFPLFFKHLIDFDLKDNHLTDFIGWTETDFPKLKSLNILNNRFNCSYLEQFLKLVPKSVRLITDEILTTRANKRKNIHGIDCIEDNNILTTVNEMSVERGVEAKLDKLDSVLDVVVYYLMFLSFIIICIAVKAFEYCKFNRKLRPNTFDRIVLYHSDNTE